MICIALGTSVGDKAENLKQALSFLSDFSDVAVKKSSIWETAPVGPSKNTFLNAVVFIESKLLPGKILQAIKVYEEQAGRDLMAPRWSDRIIDLDIIAYNRMIYVDENLEIPHKSYKDRLFVLKPLQEISPNWVDPETGDHIDEIIRRAAPLSLSKSPVKW